MIADTSRGACDITAAGIAFSSSFCESIRSSGGIVGATEGICGDESSRPPNKSSRSWLFDGADFMDGAAVM